MSFEHIYRVSVLSELVLEESVAALATELKGLNITLPEGYLEYVTQLGSGELCDLLQVFTPDDVRYGMNDEMAWLRQESWIPGVQDRWWNACRLTVNDVKQAVGFASSAEGDAYICCPKFGPCLFELPRHSNTIREFPNGFSDVVDACVKRMEHDFPFITSSGTRNRGFDVCDSISIEQFVEMLVKRWGNDGHLQTRKQWTEQPSLFFRSIQARFQIYVGENRSPQAGDGFTVTASYDIGCEDDVAEFVDSILLEGGKSWANGPE